MITNIPALLRLNDAQQVADGETNRYGITHYVAEQPDGVLTVCTFEEFNKMSGGCHIIYTGKWD